MTAPPAREGAAYMPQLDGLRAVAATAVVFAHFYPKTARLPFSMASGGVWLFLTISGFLITGILVRARDDAGSEPGALRRAWGRFYARRVLRLWPLYYVVIAAVALMGLPGARRIFPWAFFHLTNFGLIRGMVREHALNLSLGHFWTLAVEEQFYLVWPPVILFAPRRLLTSIAVAAVIAAPACRLALIVATKSWLVAVWTPVSCLDGLGLGAVLALLAGSSARRRGGFLRLCLAAGLGCWALAVAARIAGASENRTVTAELLAYSLASVWLVDRASAGFTGPAGRFLTLPPVLYVGRISYGVYVLHLPVEQALDLIGRGTGLPVAAPAGGGWLAFAYLYAATLACASASWHLLEKPMNGLKRHLPYPAPPRGPSGATTPRAVAV